MDSDTYTKDYLLSPGGGIGIHTALKMLRIMHVGSNPILGTKLFLLGLVTQLEELRILTPSVEGSSPSWPTKSYRGMV